jgi:hypothetical protein
MVFSSLNWPVERTNEENGSITKKGSFCGTLLLKLFYLNEGIFKDLSELFPF